MKKGWYGNKQRHGLASRGIKSNDEFREDQSPNCQNFSCGNAPLGCSNKQYCPRTFEEERHTGQFCKWHKNEELQYDPQFGLYCRACEMDVPEDDDEMKSNGISLTQKRVNKKMADEIKKFLIENDFQSDLRIYFNGMAYGFNSNGNMSILEDIKGSDYTDYANDNTITMTFEGSFYEIMNGYNKYTWSKQAEFSKILEKYGYHYELGNAWNLALYK